MNDSTCTNNNTVDWRESLERAVQEVEALQAIYGNFDNDDDDGNGGASCQTGLTIKSKNAWDEARELLLLESGTSSATTMREQIPTLELEIQVYQDNAHDNNNNNNNKASVCLYFGLMPGYPSHHKPVSVTIVTHQGITRTARDSLVQHLQAKAQELIGSEAIWELVQECQEHLTAIVSAEDSSFCTTTNETTSTTTGTDNHSTNMTTTKNPSSFSRRWIWVHHITDRQRKDDIVQEAQEHGLSGYLKAGYPGIVVLEGSIPASNDFVSWIKGNKSRPGGFGRQWGHHVRGELVVTQRKLPHDFVSLKEDMSVLASKCKEHDLEDEFKKFVMQHG